MSEKSIESILEFPKSVCTCGHSGDGPNSQHKDNLAGISPGHGACAAPGCLCEQFTWKRFIGRDELIPHSTKRMYLMKKED